MFFITNPTTSFCSITEYCTWNSNPYDSTGTWFSSVVSFIGSISGPGLAGSRVISPFHWKFFCRLTTIGFSFFKMDLSILQLAYLSLCDLLTYAWIGVGPTYKELPLSPHVFRIQLHSLLRSWCSLLCNYIFPEALSSASQIHSDSTCNNLFSSQSFSFICSFWSSYRLSFKAWRILIGVTLLPSKARIRGRTDAIFPEVR